MTELVVCNAGPLIHLDQLKCLDLLSDFLTLLVPDVVWNEVLKYRPHALPQSFATLVPAPLVPEAKVTSLCRAFSLDAGEAACLAILAERGSAIFLTDDAAARLVAEEMGIEVHGTLGVLIRSVRRGKRTPPEILRLLDELPSQSTLFIKSTLLADIKRKLREEWRLGE